MCLRQRKTYKCQVILIPTHPVQEHSKYILWTRPTGTEIIHCHCRCTSQHKQNSPPKTEETAESLKNNNNPIPILKISLMDLSSGVVITADCHFIVCKLGPALPFEVESQLRRNRPMPSNQAMGKTYCIQLDNVGARSVSLLVLAHFALTLLQILPQEKRNSHHLQWHHPSKDK